MLKLINIIQRMTCIIALILIAQISINAAQAIVLHQTDGQELTILLEKKPLVTFDDTDIILTADDNVVAIPRANIVNIDFVEISGIEPTEIATDIFEIVAPDTYRVNTADTRSIGLYDISGRALSAASITTDGAYTTVGMAACAPGIYIISYNNKSFKIIKK